MATTRSHPNPTLSAEETAPAAEAASIMVVAAVGEDGTRASVTAAANKSQLPVSVSVVAAQKKALVNTNKEKNPPKPNIAKATSRIDSGIRPTVVSSQQQQQQQNPQPQKKPPSAATLKRQQSKAAMANSTITTSTTTTSMVAASKPVPKPVLKPVPKPRAPSVVPPPATPAASRLKKSASSMSLADTVKKPVASLATARKPASTMDLKAGAAAGRNKTLFPGTTKKPASSTFPAGVPPANAALKTENEKLKKENMDLKMQLESLTMEMQTLKLSSAAPTATVDVPVSGARYSTDASHTIAEFLTEAGTTQVPAPPPCPAEVEEQIHEETIDAQSPPHASVTVAFVEEVEETYENDFEEEQTQQLEPPSSIPDNVGASAVLPIVLEAEEEMQPEKRMEVVEELQRVGDDEEEEAKRRAMGRRKSVRRATMKVDVPAAAAVEAEVVGVAAEAAEEAAGRALRSRKVRV